MIEGPTLAVLTIRGDQFEFERTAQESAGTLGNRRLVVTPQMASLDDIHTIEPTDVVELATGDLLAVNAATREVTLRGESHGTSAPVPSLPRGETQRDDPGVHLSNHGA